MITFNTALGRQIYDQIAGHRESWDQDCWGFNIGNDCGTTACVAGWAAHFTGWKSAVNTFDSTRVTKDGREMLTELVGEDELGLTPHQSRYLFNGDRTFEQVEDFLLDPEERAKSLWSSPDDEEF